ncbi:MAG: M20 family peptidase [Clostridia bacterium]|nr:M20 family peptidase [Clostridia bacterium]
MELKERISRWIDCHEQDLIRDTSRLVAIRSVHGAPAPGAPFGEGPDRALEEALDICSGYGFSAKNHNGYVGTADLNDLPPKVDILGHLDVVGEGTGWDSDPYTAVEKDGCLYGRGTDDNKGPIIAALLAMRCVRDLGLPLRYNTRMIMGTNEESGSHDLPYYYAREKAAPYTFTPDSGFPVYNTEKGEYKPQFTMDWAKEDSLPRLASLGGGFRINVIPGDAKATVLGMNAASISETVIDAGKRLGVSVNVATVPGGVEIGVNGKQAHAAAPWNGNNGITALLGLLATLPLADCSSTRAIKTLNSLLPHGDCRGEALGIAQRDDVSGELTVAFSLLSITESGIEGRFDSRFPLCANTENCKNVVEERFAEGGFAVTGDMGTTHHTPADSEFVQVLLRCYETFADSKGECLSSGGSTYVHDINGGVGFGACMPGFATNLHGANERMNIKDMLCAAKIFALAIAELCGGE